MSSRSNRFVAEFIGESAFLKAELEGGEHCRCAGQPLRLSHAPAARGPGVVMLRPERLRIVEGQADGAENMLTVRVTNTIYQGDSFLLQAQLANGGALNARGIAGQGSMAALPPAGAELRLGFRVADTVWLADARGNDVLVQPPHGRRQRPGLRRDETVERWTLLGSECPALLLVLVTMIAPVAWLFGLSFLDDQGAFSLEHYRRMIEQPSYGRTFLVTFQVSLLTTAICILAGLPAGLCDVADVGARNPCA